MDSMDDRTAPNSTESQPDSVSIDYSAAPPCYEEVVSSTRYPPPVQNPANAWKLGFVDFTAHIPDVLQLRNINNFKSLLKKANTWLQQNSSMGVYKCETVTWLSTSLEELNNTEIVRMTKSFSKTIKTKYLRGLRLWIYPRSPDSLPIRLGVFDQSPKSKSDSIETLINRVNKSFKDTPIAGRILNVETLSAPWKNDRTQTSATLWQERSTETRNYAFFLRIFFVESFPAHEIISFQDFVPNLNEVGETFSKLMDNANQWIRNCGCNSRNNGNNIGGISSVIGRLVNLQTIFVKLKSSDKVVNSLKCFFCEHGSKSDGGSATFYSQILRLFYIKSSSTGGGGGNGVLLNVNEIDRNHPLFQITKRTFAPLSLPLNNADNIDENGGHGGGVLRHETFSKTIERISCWLDAANVSLFDIQTVAVRMFTGGQLRLGPECLRVWNMAESNNNNNNNKIEDWLIYVRIYVKGTVPDISELRYSGIQQQQQYHGVLPAQSSLTYMGSTRSGLEEQHNVRSFRSGNYSRSCIMFVVGIAILLCALIIVVYLYLR